MITRIYKFLRNLLFRVTGKCGQVTIDDLLRFEVCNKDVLIKVVFCGEMVNKVKGDIHRCLRIFKDRQVVKFFRIRKDHFMVRPMDNWKPEEGIIRIKKWLNDAWF